MAVDLTPLDPDDDADVDAYHRVMAEAQAADVPDFPPLTRREIDVRLRYPEPDEKQLRWVARLDGAPVGALNIDLPVLDNTHVANVDLAVAPQWRRRGIGRELYHAAVEYARAAGRKVLMGSYVVALAGGTLRDPAFAAFAEAMGVQAALPEVRRRLDLTTVDTAAWAPMRDDAMAHAPGYTVVAWTGHAPDDLIAEVARLEGRMVTDAPMGDLMLEQERYDAERMRATEAKHLGRGERLYSVGARHDVTGTLAAWTALEVHPDTDYHSWQETTIVDPEHRGHRLGLLVKIDNLNQIIASEPNLRYVDTWNAAENAHMIAINEQLGFRAVDGWVSWQHEI
jgi:GNAT superfamily N-acetyltransferase